MLPTRDRPPRIGNQHPWDRGASLTLAFVLGFTLLCVALGAALLSLPGDGCQLAGGDLEPPRPIQACFGTWPTPLRPGDRIVAVEGVPIGGDSDDFTVGASPAPPSWDDGSTVSYTVLRAGKLLHLRVPLGRLGALGILHAFWAALVSQIYDFSMPHFLGSLVIFLLAPQAGAARLLLIASGPLFAMTTFVWAGDTVGAQFVQGPVWVLALTLNSLWGWLFVPTVLLLVLSFPQRVWPVSRWPRRSVVVIYGLPAAAWLVTLLSRWAGPYVALLALGALTVVCCAIGLMLHTLLRVRDPVLRAQTGWMALGIGVGFAFWPLIWSLTALVPGVNGVLSRLPGWSEALLSLVIGVTFPLSMGIAITRYRLFDIEVLIERTLVYGTLTALLALVYWVGVILLQQLFRPLIGQSNTLAIVASTLAVAALFQPLRQRIQIGIDRRFYRRKYNAARILVAFSAHLRDEVDLDTLNSKLVAVVEETFQPAHVSLWLRDGSPRMRKQQVEER